jgi:hypothetical protein
VQSTPDGFVYQWRGLPPAIPVRWSDELVAQGHDPYLDAAIAAVTSAAVPTAARRQLP